MSQGQPSDKAQRELALDITRSCCVQAPAGSGKTELLTQRILKLLSASDRPEEILAITFTRKAAAEMRHRLLDNLEEAARVNDDELAAMKPHKQQTLALARAVLERDKSLGWSLLSNTSRLRINTIDSFNQFLVNQLPITSSLGMLPDITDKPREIFRDAIRDTLEELAGKDSLAVELHLLLSHLNNQWQSLEDLLCRLLEKRDQWLTYILFLGKHREQTRELMEKTLREIVASTLADLSLALTPYLPDLLPLLQYAMENIAAETALPAGVADIAGGLPEPEPEAMESWSILLAVLVKKDFEFRKRVTKSEGFPAHSGTKDKLEKDRRKTRKESMEALLITLAQDTELLEAVEAFGTLPATQFDDGQWRVLESLTDILPALVSRLSLAFARNRKTDYNHVSSAALEALGDPEQPTDLALRLDYQLKHILVDEFQDTSTLQVQLLQKLTGGWQPGDGRTLFIVGDGMQSCYGFRNARVGYFLHVRDNGIGDVCFEDLRLECNFRSESAVVGWVNEVFSGAFPSRDDISRGGVSYNPATAVHDNSPLAGVRTWLVAADKDLDDAASRQKLREAELVADEVISICESCPGDSIAILVRTRNHLRELIPVLREKGIAWQASEIDPLLSYPLVRDLLSLTRAMLNPADTPAWYALMRSPLMGMCLADIHRVSRHAAENTLSPWETLQAQDDIPGLCAETLAILGRVIPLLRLARQQRQRLGLRDWIEDLWLLLGGPACMEDMALAANAEQFFTLLEEHDAGGDIEDIHLFEAELGSVFGSGQQPEAALQIMTIHKAKGLEFDHVIIPGLDRSPRGNDNPLLLWKEHITEAGEERLVMSLPSQKGKDRDSDSIYRYLKSELELEQRLETTRLLYIAVTRAIRQAILVGCVSTEEGEPRNPARQSLLARIWPQLLDRIDGGDCRIIPVDDESPLPPTSRRVPDRERLLTRRLPPAWRSPLESITEAGTGEPLLPADQEQAAHLNLLERKIGDIIHHALMLVAQGSLDLQNPAQLKRLETVWERELAPVSDEPQTALAEIHRQLEACRHHERFPWLLTDSHEGQASEQAISDFSRGGRQEFIIDRTFLDADGNRWIIDYKSSRPGTGESLEAFCERQANRYRGQLANYARLFRQMEQAPVRTALFFTALPHFLEIESDKVPEPSQDALF